MELSAYWTIITPDCCNRSYALPTQVVRNLQNTHETFYCAMCGSTRHYPQKSDLELAHEAQARAERRAKLAAQERERAERSAAATRGHLTRIKRRVGSGVCPCCNRTFPDLAAHMKGQHPGWAAEET